MGSHPGSSPWRRASRRWRGVSLFFIPEKASLTRFFFFSCISRTYVIDRSVDERNLRLCHSFHLGLDGILCDQLIHVNGLCLTCRGEVGSLCIFRIVQTSIPILLHLSIAWLSIPSCHHLQSVRTSAIQYPNLVNSRVHAGEPRISGAYIR